MPTFSLITTTLAERRDELLLLLSSLNQQTFKDFEVILVDQSGRNRVREMLEGCEFDFALRIIPSARGISLGRNVGLEVASGDWVLFPDDDCHFLPDTLERLYEGIRLYRADGFVIRPEDPFGAPLADVDKLTQGHRLTLWQLSRSVISFSLVISRDFLQKMDLRFDPTLGLGSGGPFSAGEENDLVFRLHKAGATFVYLGSVRVVHPRKKSLDRERLYSRSFGWVYRKNRLYGFFAYYLLRSLGGILWSFVKGDLARARHHFYQLLGRLEGFFWHAL